MALNFPDNPTTGQLYTDSTAGFTYEWDGVVWKSYTASASKNISIVDNIEGSFNGSTQTFALAVSGVSLTPANAQQLRVVLGGIVQEPITNYTVSGPNITFITAPIAGLDCSIVSLGPAVPVSVPGDGTVTPVKLSTGGPSWNTSGGVTITGGINVVGVVTATSFVGNGSGLTGAGSTVADDTTTNATFYPLFTQTTSGTVTASKVSTTKLSFNPSTGGLSVTSLSGSLANTLTLNTSGTGLSGSTTYNNSGATTFTVTSNATSSNTVSTIVARDASGNFSAGTITATTFSGSGSSLTSLNADNISSGTVPTSRLASGTANSSTYLRGDQTWAAVTSGISITNDTSTNSTFYPTFTSATTGSISGETVSSTKLTFNPSTGVLSATQVTTLSDETKKTDITPIVDAVEVTKQLNGVKFKWKDNNQSSIGVIAQEVEKILPEVVNTDSEGTKSVNYGSLIGILIEAIKEQQIRIENLEKQISK